MNLDLLKKLTRLANNNPNDNEANLAARCVCKMLQECNWILTSNTPPKFSNQTQNSPQYSSDEDYYNDVYSYFRGGFRGGKSYYQTKEGPKTWNDVHRSTEPEFKSKYGLIGKKEKPKK